MKVETFSIAYSEKEKQFEHHELSPSAELEVLSDQLINDMILLPSDSIIHINRSIEKPTASIIISVFNATNFLDKAIESVLRQENLPPCEILIAYDKGSKSETAGYLRKCINLFKGAEFRIAFMAHKSDFREKILTPSLCKGEYIFFLDYDDEFASTKVSNQIQGLESQKKQFSCTNHMIIDQDNRIIKGRVLTSNPKFDIGALTKANKVNMSSICIKREFYEKNLKPLSSHLSDSYFDFVLPDYLFTLIASCKKQISYLPEPQLLYRIHQFNTLFINDDEPSEKKLPQTARVNEKRIKTFTAFSIASNVLDLSIDITFGFVILINSKLSEVSLFRFATKVISSKLFRRFTAFFTETLQDRSFLRKNG